jgi:uncharacterized Ntn-hydrolase superfamily protein
MTYSIVALDEATGELGVAVQTRWLNVGAWVPWVEPGIGAVATQSFTEPGHGFNGLRLMREGLSAPEALAQVLASDDGQATRQVGIVDAAGRSAAHTGTGCVRYASHIVEPGVSVQANMMERPTVPAAMLEAYRGADGDLAARLLAALHAAEAEGGDVRGRQSAALLVAPGARSGGAGEAPIPSWARRHDLRVEDSRAPLDELSRLLRLARAYDAMGEAEQAGLRGDMAGAAAAGVRSLELAPDDDMVVLWGAVGLAMAGRTVEARAALEAAAAVEPRSAEHLRRFAEAGHLPGGAEVLRVLGIDRS